MRSFPPSPLWLILALALSTPSLAQQSQSYQSYQRLSGKVVRSVGSPEKKSPQRGAPMKFQGWKHPGKFGPEYLEHFSRPGARQTRGEILASAARTAVHPNGGVPQAVPPLAGLLFRDSLPAGFIPTSVATGDFNGDGNMDFVVANGGDNNLWLYFGNGNGTFSLPIILPITLGQSPVWVATADLRGIGRTDLVVAESDSNSVGVFLANGDGTFVESSIALPGSAVTLAIGDYNHDGKLDIAVPMADSNSPAYIVVLPGLGNGTFATPIVTPTAQYAPETFWVSSGDLNGDGFPDLVLTNNFIDDISIQVFLNNGDGTFSAGQVVFQNDPVQFLSTALFDGDEDSNLDLVVTDSVGYLWFAHGNGDGTFSTTPTKFGTGDFAFGIGVADVNGDGHLDVITSGNPEMEAPGYGATAGNLTSVLLGDGKGNFGPATVYRGDLAAFSLAIADFNGDGHPDIVTADQDTDSAVVFLNNGTGGFGEPQGSWIGELPGSFNSPASDMMSVDVNGDGKPDLVLMEYPGSDSYDQLTVLLNQVSGNFSAPIRSDAIKENGSSLPCFGDFVLADFRGTGLPDFLAIGCDASFNQSAYISFAPSAGGGQFGAPTATAPAGAQGVLGVADFNGDGKLDFVAVTGGIGTAGTLIQVTAFLGNGDGTFRTGPIQTFGNTSEYPVAVYVGDFNRDGKPDILVFPEANGGETQAQVYELFGNGDGSFQSAQLLFSNFGPMIVADVNSDGHPDIIESAFDMNISGNLVPAQFSIYLGQADGSFALSETYAPYVYGSLIPQYAYGTSAAEHYAPMIGDFNGDGNVDIAAFQSAPTNPNTVVLVQFMLGNGDGTFTPTYTAFGAQMANFPNLAMDVNGNGQDDMVELDGLTSSFHVIPVGAGPSFQLELGGDPVAGSTGSAILTLAVPSSSPTAVALSASDPTITVPATVTVPAGQVSQTFTFSVGPTFNANHVFALTARLATQTAIAYGTQVGSGAKGFTVLPLFDPLLGVSVSTINLAAGQSSPSYGYIVNVNSVNGYSGTLNLECLGLPGQSQCQFAPATLPIPPGGGAQARVVLSVPAGTAAGSYAVTLQATDGALYYDLPLTLNVGDFTMSISPTLQQAFPTDTANYTLTLTSIDNYNGSVNLTCTGLPAGASCPSSLNNSPTPSGSALPFAITTQSVPTGNYPFTMTGVSSPLTHSASATLQVWDFLPSVAPTSATVNSSGSATFTVTVASANGFNANVTFSCGAPGNISCSFSQTSATVPAGGTVTSTLTLTATSQAGSVDQGRAHLALAFAILGLPLGGLLITVTGSQRRWFSCILLLLLVCWSCGGGSSGGGGGGGGTPYSISVRVTSGNNAKNAGTITLTVN